MKLLMYNKITILLFFYFISSQCFSQDSAKVAIKTNHYIEINHYKKLYGEISKKDSLTFFFKDSDTLVLLTGEKRPKYNSVPYEERDSVFLDIYKDVVYNKSKKDIKMKYWQDDIKLYFDKSVNKKYKKKLLKFAKKLSLEIDSLNIYEVDEREISNFFIYEVNKNYKYRFDPKINNSDGSGYYIYWDGQQRLYNCNLELNSLILFNEKLLYYHLKQDFFKALGQFYRTEKLDCESMLSKCYNGSDDISLIDLEILKYHYSFGICKGTDLETFEEQHLKALEMLKKQNRRLHFLHQY